MVKVGMEHPAIGDFFQNGFHTLIGSPHLTKSTVTPYTPYIKSGRYNPYSNIIYKRCNRTISIQYLISCRFTGY